MQTRTYRLCKCCVRVNNVSANSKHTAGQSIIMFLQAEDWLSNDGAESVGAKQEASGCGQQEVEDTGSNHDAESVRARSEPSDDESDMEEGEIQGMWQIALHQCCRAAHLFHITQLEHGTHSQHL